MASPPSTIYHRPFPSLSPDNIETWKKKQRLLEQLTKENFDLKLKMYHLEEVFREKCSTSVDSTQNAEQQAVKEEELKKDLAEKNQLLMQARTIIYQYETQLEKLKHELSNSFKKEEFDAIAKQVKSLQEQVTESESKLEEALQNVETANNALVNEEAMNQELQVELERFNNEFRCRVECLEQEVLSQKLNSLTNLEAKSVQTDVYTLKYENQLQEMEAKLQKKEEDLQDVTSKRKAELQHVCELESQVRQLQNFLCHNEGISDLMCHAEELKAELAEDRDKNKQIYELTWKLEKAEARIRDMEVELLTKEKETKIFTSTLVEREKEKFAVQGSLQELEDTLMESEAKLHQASENRKKYEMKLEMLQMEIEDLNRQYEESIHHDQDEALAAKDAVISQLHSEIKELHAKLKEKNDLESMQRLEMTKQGTGMGKTEKYEEQMVKASPITVALRKSTNIQTSCHKQDEEYITRRERELLSQVRLAEQLLLEKEEDLFFMEETLQRSKKELEVALSDMSFYQELACQLQKDIMAHESFLQDIRNAANRSLDARGQRLLEELLEVLQKLDTKVKGPLQLEEQQQSSGDDNAASSHSGVITREGEMTGNRNFKTRPGVGKLQRKSRMNSSSCSSHKSKSAAESLLGDFREGTTHSDLNFSHSTSSHDADGVERKCKDSSKCCLLKPDRSGDLASLESHFWKAVDSQSSQVADCHFIEDLLFYLKLQHQKLDESQYRLEKLEKERSGHENFGPEAVLPTSVHIPALYNDSGTIPLANNTSFIPLHASTHSSSSSSMPSTTNHALSHYHIQGTRSAGGQWTKTTSGYVPSVMATRRSTSKEENGEGVARKESATPAPEESNSEGRLNIESNVTSSNDI